MWQFGQPGHQGYFFQFCLSRVVLLLKYSDLPNKPADPNKRVGREDFLIYYMTNFEQGGKICHLLHKKIEVRVDFFFKNANPCMLFYQTGKSTCYQFIDSTS